MKTTGKLQGITRDWKTDKFIVSVLLDGFHPETIDGYQDRKLSVELKPYRERRSLSANAYFHLLAGKIGEALGISKQRAKNILIGRYGQPFLTADDEPAVIKSNVPISQMLELEEPHCMPCGGKTENGKELTFYRLYRGSHTYDTKEMSVLIDGTVSEAEGLGIETLPSDEMQRILADWEKRKKRECENQ